jgi:hypothetical protein
LNNREWGKGKGREIKGIRLKYNTFTAEIPWQKPLKNECTFKQ